MKAPEVNFVLVDFAELPASLVLDQVAEVIIEEANNQPKF